MNIEQLTKLQQELNAANERIRKLEAELLRCDTAFKSIKITTGLIKCATRHNAILRLKINKDLS